MCSSDLSDAASQQNTNAAPKSSVSPKEAFFTPKNGVMNISKNILAPAVVGAAGGAALSSAVGKAATRTEFGRQFGNWAGKLPVPGYGKTVKQTAPDMVNAREKIADKMGEIPLIGQTLKTGYQNLYKNSKFNTSSATPSSSTPKSDTTPTTKTENPSAPKTDSKSSSDKPVSVVHTKGGDYNVYAKGSDKIGRAHV